MAISKGSMYLKKPMTAKHTRQLGLIVILLAAQFFLRTHSILAQPGFIDEGLHNQRASVVWQFQVNPGSFSQGKLLSYFWMGLFEGNRETALYVSRTAIALVSLLSGAAIYLIGRQMHSQRAGLLALGIYAVLPLALFHERMAFADPFAAVFSCLLVWRSLVFARKPSLREGVILGLLLGAATLAKLTLAYLPLLPVAATVIYSPTMTTHLRGRIDAWLRTYFPALVLAGGVVLVMWAPFAIPAFLARNTDHPFVLLNETNLADTRVGAATTGDLAGQVLVELGTMNSWPLLIAFAAACLYLLIVPSPDKPENAGPLLLVVWLALLLIPMVGLASYAVTRYAMPAAAPIALILSLAFWRVRETFGASRIVRFALVAAAAAWLIGFAVPFAFFAMAAPQNLPLSNMDRYYLLSDYAVASDSRHLADYLSRPALMGERIFADARSCAFLFMASAHDMQCLPLGNLNASGKQKLVE